MVTTRSMTKLLSVTSKVYKESKCTGVDMISKRSKNVANTSRVVPRIFCLCIGIVTCSYFFIYS